MEEYKPFGTQRKYDMAKAVLNSLQKDGLDPKKAVKIMDKLIHQSEAQKYESVKLLTMSDIENYSDPVNLAPAIKTGVVELDNRLDGFMPGEVIVFGGYSNLGKSTITMYMLKTMAEAGHKVCLFAFEDHIRVLKKRANRLNSGCGFKPGNENFKVFPMSQLAPFYKDKFNLIPAIEAVVAAEGVKVVCLDMINDVLDTVNDKDAADFMKELEVAAARLNITLFLIARLRKVSNLSQASKDADRYQPTSESISGISNLEYTASKILTISSLPKNSANSVFVPQRGPIDPEIQPFAIHVCKNREGGGKTIQLAGALGFEWHQYGNMVKLKQLGFVDYV